MDRDTYIEKIFFKYKNKYSRTYGETENLVIDIIKSVNVNYLDDIKQFMNGTCIFCNKLDCQLIG